MSDKTDYQRLKKKLVIENISLHKENNFFKEIIKIAQGIMTDKQEDQFIKKMGEYLKS